MHCLAILVLVFSCLTVFGQDCPPGVCLSDETCCPTGTAGNYSCCPFVKAVCCADLIHCCPPNTECDEVGECRPKVRQQSKLLNLDDLEKRQGESEKLSDDSCEPGTCLPDETCCPTGIPGDYSCCPHENAVCCEGNTFCCPENTKCDIAKGECISNEESGESKLEKRQGLADDGKNLKLQYCEDDSLCPSDSTCCMIGDGIYGCCPHTDATCCPDMIHCCPQGESCDVTSRYCIGTRIVHHSSVKGRAIPILPEDSV